MAYDAQFSYADEFGGRRPCTHFVRLDAMVWLQELESDQTIGARTDRIKRVSSSPLRQPGRICSGFYISQCGLPVFPLHLGGILDSAFLDYTEICRSIQRARSRVPIILGENALRRHKKRRTILAFLLKSKRSCALPLAGALCRVRDEARLLLRGGFEQLRYRFFTVRIDVNTPLVSTGLIDSLALVDIVQTLLMFSTAQ